MSKCFPSSWHSNLIKVFITGYGIFHLVNRLHCFFMYGLFTPWLGPIILCYMYVVRTYIFQTIILPNKCIYTCWNNILIKWNSTLVLLLTLPRQMTIDSIWLSLPSSKSTDNPKTDWNLPRIDCTSLYLSQDRIVRYYIPLYISSDQHSIPLHIKVQFYWPTVDPTNWYCTLHWTTLYPSFLNIWNIL